MKNTRKVRIVIEDLPKDKKVSEEEMRQVSGGSLSPFAPPSSIVYYPNPYYNPIVPPIVPKRAKPQF